MKYEMKINVQMPNGKTFSEGKEEDAEKVANIKWVPGHYGSQRKPVLKAKSTSTAMSEQQQRRLPRGYMQSISSPSHKRIRPRVNMTHRARNYIHSQDQRLQKQRARCQHCGRMH